jgi:hypothetical protein
MPAFFNQLPLILPIITAFIMVHNSTFDKSPIKFTFFSSIFEVSYTLAKPLIKSISTLIDFIS